MIGSLFFLTWVPATENDRPDLGTVKEGRDTGTSEAASALRGLNLSPRRMANGLDLFHVLATTDQNTLETGSATLGTDLGCSP